MPDQQSSGAVPIALLYQAGDLGGHLRTALNELGAAIVYESQASRLDRTALEGSGARIVVFNLDPESESEIDHVYDVLDAGDYEVVFNDADVSAQLSGWDQARWARNLAAKILHKPEIATPPRPAWAESVPTPEQMAATRADAQLASAARAPVPAPRPAPEPAPAPAPAPAPVIAPAPVQSVPEPAPAPAPTSTPVAAAEPPTPTPAEAPTLELPILEGFDLGDLQIEMDSEAPPAAAATATGFADALDDFAAAVPVSGQRAPNADDFASELDALFASASGSAQTTAMAEPADESSADADAGIDFPSFFDHNDAAAVPEAVDRTYKPAPLPGQAAPAEPPEAAPAPVAAEPLLPPDWTLEPLTDEEAGAKPIEKSSAFGIETMTTSEFLTPDEDVTMTPVTPAGDAFSLELMPMEDAVAPQAYVDAPAAAPPVPESVPTSKFQLGTAAQLRRVFVLGASIGGPEAVREFLGALPAQFPALFVLAQHMGDEFLELMSMQLAKAVKLTVRTPTHGEHVGHGEIVIVPTRERMRIDGEGVITLSPLIERTPYSPSIDQVMRDIADEFGSKAGAIVFSGMAQDAIDGSKYVVAHGGTVWAQDPDSCTISTMVDSVRQTGAVSFIGSPQQLATKLVADFGA